MCAVRGGGAGGGRSQGASNDDRCTRWPYSDGSVSAGGLAGTHTMIYVSRYSTSSRWPSLQSSRFRFNWLSDYRLIMHCVECIKVVLR